MNHTTILRWCRMKYSILFLRFLLAVLIPGGMVSKVWNNIVALVSFFFLLYLTFPFFILLSQQTKDIIVAFVFLFGAMYVLINIRLVYRIIMVMKGE